MCVRPSSSFRPEQRGHADSPDTHEMSHQDIANVLGSSVGAVKASFFHAMSNLKKQLGDEVP